MTQTEREPETYSDGDHPPVQLGEWTNEQVDLIGQESVWRFDRASARGLANTILTRLDEIDTRIDCPTCGQMCADCGNAGTRIAQDYPERCWICGSDDLDVTKDED